ncbi:hypothetical protein GH714_040362 [Hevea brasiliensis]|uniref:Uncharacterized protein n=1 Tax=Hevea brasiliensis TaxID=3981 RepID=A0A6A6K8U1_HEVBR|nr:hypothetical protein GH714_040362 [Hevea brasiliensis]
MEVDMRLALMEKGAKTKDDEVIDKKANAYVQARNNILAEMLKGYLNDDFIWLEKLAPSAGVESENDGEEARESHNVNAMDPTSGDPPAT